MHMADALVSPAVGGTLWAATAATTAYCARKVQAEAEEGKVPLMGVLGAFIFAAQMINFTIPGTGSSGHLAGGMILAVLLGPHAAFLVMASVLTVQALFFADGGLLALGANIFNLGVFPCFIAYPLLFRPLAGRDPGPGRLAAASIASAIVALELGALGVVLETTASGVAELPFQAFLLLMLPIHLAIGLVEGLVTAAVVTFVWRAQPELVERGGDRAPSDPRARRRLLVGGLVAVVVVGACLSWFASSNPDGLEWSIARVTGAEEVEGPPDAVRERLADVQATTAVLPDYGLPSSQETGPEGEAAAWPTPDAGTSVSGLVGGGLTLLIAVGVGWVLHLRFREPAGALEASVSDAEPPRRH